MLPLLRTRWGTPEWKEQQAEENSRKELISFPRLDPSNPGLGLLGRRVRSQSCRSLSGARKRRQRWKAEFRSARFSKSDPSLLVLNLEILMVNFLIYRLLRSYVSNKHRNHFSSLDHIRYIHTSVNGFVGFYGSHEV